jgi:hypothetical protein
MTIEQFEKCKDFEQQFRWAVNSNFLHMSNTEFNKIAALYLEVFGEALTRNQMTCNTCRLKAMQRLGNDYFTTQQTIAEEDKKNRIEEKPKKSGRPKKIDLDAE